MVCHEGEHASMVFVCVVFMLLYILGIPLGMFLALFRNRHALWDDSHAKHDYVNKVFGGLYHQCASLHFGHTGLYS